MLFATPCCCMFVSGSPRLNKGLKARCTYTDLNFPHLRFSSADIVDVCCTPEGMLASACARMVKLMAKRYREEVMEKLDIWSESKRSKSEQLSFKAELIAFYKRQDPNNQHKLFCIALDMSLPCT